MVAASLANQPTEGFSSLRARFDAARERCASACAGARKKVIAGAKYTDETVRENPYRVLAIAAGVALLVGLLVGRGTRSPTAQANDG